MTRAEKAFAILVENGYKTTEPRRVLIDFLTKEENKHLSCDEIYDRLSDTHPNIGIATVYRNMQLFEELNIATKLTLDDSIARYELADFEKDGHQHHHLVCLNCGKLIEVREDLLGCLEKELEEEYSFQIVDHDLKFYGICKECKQN